MRPASNSLAAEVAQQFEHRFDQPPRSVAGPPDHADFALDRRAVERAIDEPLVAIAVGRHLGHQRHALPQRDELLHREQLGGATTDRRRTVAIGTELQRLPPEAVHVVEQHERLAGDVVEREPLLLGERTIGRHRGDQFLGEQRLGPHALLGDRQRDDADVELAGQAIGDQFFGQLFFDGDLACGNRFVSRLTTSGSR